MKILLLVITIVLLFTGCYSPTYITPAPTQPPAQQPPAQPPPEISEPQTTPPSTPSVTPVTSPVIPKPPEVPPEVLSVWKSAPASEALPPYISGKATLKPNPNSKPAESSSGNGDLNVSMSVIPAAACHQSIDFYLKEGQWMDVFVSSIDVPIYLFTEEPGAASFQSNHSIVDYGNIYKLLAVNFDPDSPHYLKYSISSYTATPLPLAPATSPSPEIGDAPASLPLSADVNLAPFYEGEWEKSFAIAVTKYLAATKRCIHAGPAISLSQGDTVRLTLESDCPIDWYGMDWGNPKPQIGIHFVQLASFSSVQIDTKSVVSSNEGRKLEIVLSTKGYKRSQGCNYLKEGAPFCGKALYQNRIPSTDKGTIFNTAARIFAFEGEGDYCFTFYNWSREKGCEITYRGYVLSGSTPGWEDYAQTKLQPWLNTKTSSQQEYDKAIGQWLEQFK